MAKDRASRLRCTRIWAMSMIVALLAAALVGVPASAATRTAAQGVTDDEIQIVALVADLDGLRARGLISSPKLTTGNLLKRWQVYVDEFGPIHGRKVVLKGVVWDPIDNTSYDKACTQATQDNKPLVIVNTAGYRQSSISCLTIDNQTPLFIGDPVYSKLFEESGNKLFSMTPPSDVMGTATADVVAKRKLVPKSAKIGILSSNDIGVKAAGDALETRLKKHGFDVASKVEVNQLSADTALLNRESAAAVATFKAAGVDTVFIGINFASSQGYFQESQRANAGFENFIVDDQAAMCTMFSANRIPVEVAGTPCLTTWDTRALPTEDGIKKDSTAEAKCRATFDARFAEKSQPGVPSGDVTVGGVTYTEDAAFDYCSMTNLLLPAIKKAGKKLTWDKVAANLEKTTSAPAILMSGGEGGFGKGKHYFAKNVHLVRLNAANAQTAKDANGLFNGCPAPVNCWIPQLVDGQEWSPIGTGNGN
jgi:hypothetical protein